MSNINETEKNLTLTLNALDKQGALGIARKARYSFSFRERYNHSRHGQAEMILRINFSKVPRLERVFFESLQYNITGNFELVKSLEENIVVFRRSLTENYLENKKLQKEVKKFTVLKITQAFEEQGKRVKDELANIGIKDTPSNGESITSMSRTKIGDMFNSMSNFFKLILTA